MMRLKTAPRGKPVLRIEHNKTYLQDGPEQHRHRTDYESILFIRHVYEGKGGDDAFVAGVVFFDGNTRDEADQKMMDWIDSHGAVEADFEAK